MPEPHIPTIARFLNDIRHPVAIIARKPVNRFAPPMQVLWPVDLTEPLEQISYLADLYNAVYCNLNPLKDEYLHVRPRQGTSIRDSMIARRTRVLVDIDGHDIPKAEAERQKNAIKEYLGWPILLETDSGNGYGLIYECDYPKDKSSSDLVKRFLKGLKTDFPCVDVSCSNAGRLTRVIGTLNVREGERISTRILNGQVTREDASEGRDETQEAA